MWVVTWYWILFAVDETFRYCWFGFSRNTALNNVCRLIFPFRRPRTTYSAKMSTNAKGSCVDVMVRTKESKTFYSTFAFRLFNAFTFCFLGVQMSGVLQYSRFQRRTPIWHIDRHGGHFEPFRDNVRCVAGSSYLYDIILNVIYFASCFSPQLKKFSK